MCVICFELFPLRCSHKPQPSSVSATCAAVTAAQIDLLTGLLSALGTSVCRQLVT
jgi:hypothetical protein